jgi:hypothetical protein
MDEHTDDAALATYLRRHVAGAEAALGMTKALLDSETEPDVTAFLERLVDAIDRERGVVVAALSQLDEGPGLVARGLDVASNVAMKVKDVLPTDAPTELEGLEALAVGVWGKRLLWGTLMTVAELDERFRDLPLEELSRQADDQERELVRLRQRAIRAAVIHAA